MRTLLPALLALLLLGQTACAARSGQPASSVPVETGKSPSGPAPSVTAMAAAGAKFPSSLVLSVLYFEDRTKVPDLAWLRKGMVDMPRGWCMPGAKVRGAGRLMPLFKEEPREYPIQSDS